MISEKEYSLFQRELESILEDTFVQSPTDEEFQKNKYFFAQGLWSGTENDFYFYYKQNIENHKPTLLKMCKRFPKYHPASDIHAGTISSFDTLPPLEILSKQLPEDTLYNVALSNHFANLLCGANIAKVNLVSKGEDKAFLIILDRKYRSYFEKDGQEPADF